MNIDKSFLSLIQTLSEAPGSQINASVTPKFKEMLTDHSKITATNFKAILDECCYAALASDFAMVAMDTMWRQLIEEELVI